MPQENAVWIRDHLRNEIDRFGFEVGDYSYGSKPIILWGQCPAKLIIGRFCSFAFNVIIHLGEREQGDRDPEELFSC